MLGRESRTNSLTWEVMWFYPSRRFSEVMSQNTCIFHHFTLSLWKGTLILNKFWDLLSSWIVRTIKW
jgi:hypothetical protein